MRKGWTKVALRDLLEHDKRYVTELESVAYKKLSVKLYGKGAKLDNPINGADVKMIKHQYARCGQVIVSEIWAKKGAVGIVPPEGDGALVTSHFFLFDFKNDRVLPGWMNWILKGNYLESQLAAGAFGTTGYAAVRPAHFLDATIPLPPLAEQQRIVAHLDAIEARLARVQKLREASAAESLGVLRSLMNEEHCKDIRFVPMHELVTWRSPDTSVSQTESYRFAGVYSFGRGVFRKDEVSGMDFAYDRLTRIRAGEFTYPKLMAWEGALGVVPEDCEGCHVSPEFPVFTINQLKVLPEVLDIHFKTPAVWRKLADISTGTNLRRRRLNPNAFLGYLFPLPPMEVQQHVKRVADLVAMQSAEQKKAADLEKALLPALLDHVFNDQN